MKRASKRTILALLLVPSIAYPLYAGIFFLSDSLFGERIMLRQLFESRRQLWNTFWVDYMHALPVFFAITLLIFILPMLIARRYGVQFFWFLVCLGLLAGSGIGVYLANDMFSLIALTHAIVGTLLGAMFAAIAHTQWNS